MKEKQFFKEEQWISKISKLKKKDEEQEKHDAEFREMELKRAGDPEEIKLKKLEENRNA
jgi:hypothetical protein